MGSSRIASVLLVAALVAACTKGGSPGSQSSSKGVPGATFTVEVHGETAYFDAATATTSFLPGGGRVTAPGGIDCGISGGVATTACTARYPWGTDTAPTRVAITATPDVAAGYAVYELAGACTGTGACTVTGNSNRLVIVRFSRTMEGLGAHPNFTDASVHGPAYRDFVANVPGAWPCTSCHGSNLLGQGIAVSCASCHQWPLPEAPPLAWDDGNWDDTAWE